MILRINESTLYEDIAAVKKYYPNIPDDTFMELIALDPTYTGKDSVGKYGKWILNLFNRGKISEKDFEEIPELLNQFTTYKNRIQNKDLNSYKTLDDLAEILASVVDDMSMLTQSQKTKFLKRVKSGKIKVDKSDDYDMVLDTPNFIVYVPNTHEASMKLGKGTEWCTAHENPDWYNSYTEDGEKLYIIKDKKTGERWQYSDKTGDFLDQNDKKFDIPELMHQDKKLSKFFAKFLGVDYFAFDGTWIYDGNEIPVEIIDQIKKIVVADGVTSIGAWAFAGCTNLISTVIADSITSIGDDTFYNCSRLTSIIIPNSVIRIGGSAFAYCSSLTSIIVPDSVIKIGAGAFDSCSSLTNITIPDSVAIIGNSVFRNCSSLKSVTIPNSITSIAAAAFYNCSSLSNITIPDSITTIEMYAFDFCSSLTSITIPDSVTSISDRAFYYCTSLTSITIPNSVTSIGEDAFYGCKNLIVYTDSAYVKSYCQENNVSVKSLKAKNESYRPLKLKIKEF